jgi:hypothetical protein
VAGLLARVGPLRASKPIDEYPRPTRLRRRAFAITSHVDTGKTTSTEKLFFFGRAIHGG